MILLIIMNCLRRVVKKSFFIYPLFVIFSLLFSASLFASECYKYDDCKGCGKYPYNFRCIDNCFFAGGSLFNPESKENNSILKVIEYLEFLKSNGVKTIISLNYSEKNKRLKELSELCKKYQIEHLLIRMNSEKVPDDEQTNTILEKLKKGAYLHCLWGCDRTGAIIAKYLTEICGYSGEEAFKAVIKNGSHAGKLGGFKQIKGNNLLIKYFWKDGPQF